MRAAQYIQDLPGTGTFNTNRIQTGEFKALTLEQVSHGVKYCRPFAQYQNEIDLKIITQVADKNSHHQFTENGGKSQFPRSESSDQCNEKNTCDTEDNRSDRIAV